MLERYTMEGPFVQRIVVKSCPRCGIFVTKNGGCPLAICRCQYVFCWECLQNITSRDQHICTRKPSGFFTGRDFIDYFDVFSQAFDFYKMDKRKFQDVKKPRIVGCIKILINCRRILMHSVIFSFFMTSTEKYRYTMFEKLTENLHLLTDNLSTELDQFLRRENGNGSIGIVMNQIESLKASVINSIKMGYENNYWLKVSDATRPQTITEPFYVYRNSSEFSIDEEIPSRRSFLVKAFKRCVIM